MKVISVAEKQKKLYLVMDDTTDIGSEKPQYDNKAMEISRKLDEDLHKYFK